MKKLLFLLMTFFTSIGVFAQSIGVNSMSISENPAKVNQIVKFGFQIYNGSSSRPIYYDPQSPAVVVVTVQKVDPLVENGQLKVEGTASEYFKWRYEAQAHSIVFTQIKELPLDPEGYFFVSQMDFYVRITESTTTAERDRGDGHGFNVQVTYSLDILDTDNQGSTYGYTNGEISLSAAFSAFTATNKEGLLNINWTTSTENNNDRFVIYASKDGKEFKAIDSLTTKAKDGNSDEVLQYSYSKKLESLSSLLGVNAAIVLVAVLMLLGMVIFASSRRGTNKKVIGQLLVIAVAIGITVTACRKNNNEAYKSSEKISDLWFRITQIDKDGASSSSRTFKMVNE